MIQITVQDVNDNKPVFYPRNYSQNMDFTEARGGKNIVTVQAQDRDSGTFGMVTYRITGGDEGGAFVVNHKTGIYIVLQ